MAAQTLVDEKYAKADVGADTVKVGTDEGNVTKKEIADLAEVDVNNIGNVTVKMVKLILLSIQRVENLYVHSRGYNRN